MKFTATVTVKLKKGVLDPQGTAVERACMSLGYQGIRDLRIGKHIEFQLEATDLYQAEQQVNKLATELLANPVMEVFTFIIREM